MSIEELLGKGLVCQGWQLQRENAVSWNLADIAGEFVEVVGEGGATVVAALVREAQANGSPVLWGGMVGEVVYGPDLALVGVDLSALPVVLVERHAAFLGMVEATVKSGAFRLVVADCGSRRERWTEGMQLRIARQAKAMHATVVRLAATGSSSRCRLAGMKVNCRLSSAGQGKVLCEMMLSRGRSRGLEIREVWDGPDGLCMDT